jgi:hypothetical protein
VAKTLKKHNHGKDLPRYKVVVGYEKDFKMAYAKHLGTAITTVIEKLNDTNPSPDTGISQDN